MVGTPSRWSGSGRDHFGRPEVVGRPSRRSGSGQESLPEVRKWSIDTLGGLEVFVDPPGCSEVSGEPPEGPEVVGRHSQTSGGGRENLPEVWKWSRDTHGGPEVVG